MRTTLNSLNIYRQKISLSQNKNIQNIISNDISIKHFISKKENII